MRKFYLAFFSLLLMAPAFCYAQQEITTRSLAVAQLSEYGQAIYDRGDYPQAAIIFSRVLRMDPNNKEALGYANTLKKKGQDVFIPASAVAVQSKVSQIEQPVIVKEVPIDPNQDLKQEIQTTDQAIESLKVEVSNLREQAANAEQEVSTEKLFN